MVSLTIFVLGWGNLVAVLPMFMQSFNYCPNGAVLNPHHCPPLR